MDARLLSAVDHRLSESGLGRQPLFQRGGPGSRSRSRRSHLRFEYLLALLALLAAFFFGLQRISLLALDSQALSLKSATVDGATDRTGDAIREILDSWQGTSLIILNPSEIESEIRSLSWVKDARVTKRWPSKLDVAVRERTAMAVLEDGGLYLVDEAGVRLEALDPAAAPDLPRLRAEDGFARSYEEKIRLARICLQGLPDDKKRSLAAVELGIPGRVGLLLKDSPIWIYVNPAKAQAGLDYFEHKVGAWQKRFGRLEYVDLTVPDRAFLGPGKSAEGSGPSRADSKKEVQ